MLSLPRLRVRKKKERDAVSKKKLCNFYGAVAGIKVGTEWKTRKECAVAGVHKPTVAAIHTGPEGAYSILISGRYNVQDNGDCLMLSGIINARTKNGSGVMGYWDASLILSSRSQLPVRVVRSSKLNSPYAPTSGFRYDGLYSVTKCWRESEDVEGGGRHRFKMLRLRGQDPPIWGSHISSPTDSDSDIPVIVNSRHIRIQGVPRPPPQSTHVDVKPKLERINSLFPNTGCLPPEGGVISDEEEFVFDGTCNKAEKPEQIIDCFVDVDNLSECSDRTDIVCAWNRVQSPLSVNCAYVGEGRDIKEDSNIVEQSEFEVSQESLDEPILRPEEEIHYQVTSVDQGSPVHETVPVIHDTLSFAKDSSDQSQRTVNRDSPYYCDEIQPQVFFFSNFNFVPNNEWGNQNGVEINEDPLCPEIEHPTSYLTKKVLSEDRSPFEKEEMSDSDDKSLNQMEHKCFFDLSLKDVVKMMTQIRGCPCAWINKRHIFSSDLSKASLQPVIVDCLKAILSLAEGSNGISNEEVEEGRNIHMKETGAVSPLPFASTPQPVLSFSPPLPSSSPSSPLPSSPPPSSPPASSPHSSNSPLLPSSRPPSPPLHSSPAPPMPTSPPPSSPAPPIPTSPASITTSPPPPPPPLPTSPSPLLPTSPAPPITTTPPPPSSHAPLPTSPSPPLPTSPAPPIPTSPPPLPTSPPPSSPAPPIPSSHPPPSSYAPPLPTSPPPPSSPLPPLPTSPPPRSPSPPPLPSSPLPSSPLPSFAFRSPQVTTSHILSETSHPTAVLSSSSFLQSSTSDSTVVKAVTRVSVGVNTCSDDVDMCRAEQKTIGTNTRIICVTNSSTMTDSADENSSNAVSILLPQRDEEVQTEVFIENCDTNQLPSTLEPSFTDEHQKQTRVSSGLETNGELDVKEVLIRTKRKKTENEYSNEVPVTDNPPLKKGKVSCKIKDKISCNYNNEGPSTSVDMSHTLDNDSVAEMNWKESWAESFSSYEEEWAQPHPYKVNLNKSFDEICDELCRTLPENGERSRKKGPTSVVSRHNSNNHIQLGSQKRSSTAKKTRRRRLGFMGFTESQQRLSKMKTSLMYGFYIDNCNFRGWNGNSEKSFIADSHLNFDL